MAVIVVGWPSSLPQKILVDGFAYEVGDTLARSENDFGIEKVRRRFTKGIDVQSCAMDMTASQWALFQNFFNVSLNGGANQFAFSDPYTGVSYNWRFKETPKMAPNGPTYIRVTMSWEKMPS